MCLGDGLGRRQDVVGDRLRLGDHDHVRALDLGVDRELGRGLPAGPGRVLVLDQGGVQDAVLGAAFDVAQGFAFIGGEGGDDGEASSVSVGWFAVVRDDRRR